MHLAPPHPLILAAVLALCGAASAASAAGPWEPARAWAWYNKRPWIVGCNFLPSTAGNTTEFWQAESFDAPTIDRELALARSLGFNSCRVFVQYLVWKHDPEGLKARFERFLAIADSHGLSTIPVPFDDCAFGDPPISEPFLGKQRDPIPGMIASNWTPSPGLAEVQDRAAWPDLERYLRDLIGRFGKDRRVLMWDLYNEPGNSGMGSKSLPLLRAAFQWARAAKPSQPLTASIWDDALTDINQAMTELSDVVTFHRYGDRAALEAIVARCKASGRPVICTEWMARPMGSRWAVDLPFLREQKVGCYCWGLVNGRMQCQFPWWSKRGAPEPEIWFHDLFHRDGSPYDPYEVAVIRRLTNAPGVARLKPLFEHPLRDTCVCLGSDGAYYLTGTTGSPTWWQTNDGIELWRSADLRKWTRIGFVWTFERDGTWQKGFVDGKRAIWAPEIHCARGSYWIAYCVNTGGTGILRSVSGRPEGPYEDVKKDGPLTPEIDASLFFDDDGAAYFVYQNGKIARLKDDMSGLAEPPRLIAPSGAPQVGFEGAFLFKANGRYYLSCADFARDEYHSYVASAPSLNGPWSARYLAIPHGGHNMFFRDRDGRWWSTFFGNSGYAPFRERPGLLRVEFGLDGAVRPKL